MLLVALVAALVGGLVGALIVHFTWSSDSGSAGACSATSVADEVLPSVVTISANTARGQAGGTGSGEIISSDGYILTNNHVVSVAANGGSVEVLLSDGRSVSGHHRRARSPRRISPSSRPPISSLPRSLPSVSPRT